MSDSDPTLIAESVRHGTTGAYQNHGCRCDLCREAIRLAQRAYRAKSDKARQRDARQIRAYNAALAELRERHRDEFELIYQEAYHGAS